MTSTEFRTRRLTMGKTQRQVADLLGVSLRAIHSFEQGWRKIPVHVERQTLLIVMLSRRADKPETATCWKVRRCPPGIRNRCPAWEFKAGHLCWFINGTICRGEAHLTWRDKMRICRSCKVFLDAVGPAVTE